MAFETFLLIPNTYSHKKGIWIRVLGSKEEARKQGERGQSKTQWARKTEIGALAKERTAANYQSRSTLHRSTL
jgi:hypothetical protein